LYKDVVGLMSGITSLMLTILGFIKKFRLRDNPDLQQRIFWGAALICFLIASVSIWTIEHQQVLTQRTKIYREYVEEKNRRISTFRDNKFIIEQTLLQSSSLQLLIEYQKMQYQSAKNAEEEQAKFMGIMSDVRLHFHNSPVLQQLINSVLILPAIEPKLPNPDESKHFNEWVLNHKKETEEIIKEKVNQ